jgi:hypothetical protein
MMDYYSNFEGPTRDSAINIMKERVTRHKKPQWLKNFVVYFVDEEISKYGGLGSQTGWSVMVEPSIWKKLLYKEEICNKRCTWWKKLFYTMRVYNVFHKMYMDVHYKPNGEYMIKIKDKYKSRF